MTIVSDGVVSNAIRDIVEGSARPESYVVIGENGLQALPIIEDFLRQEYPIETLEKLETALKGALLCGLKGNISGPAARQVASFQKRVGFLYKYKSYTVKCSVPLGYSIFLHNQGEGFSFQQHVSRKTEIFYILEVKSGGFVFLCSHEEWLRIYEPAAFQAWLNGGVDLRYDQYKVEPEPGDVFVIDRLNVVHTVIGCVLEEYATVSTDMVDRLHDQNIGKHIPPCFNRSYVEECIENISYPQTNRHVDMELTTRKIVDIEPTYIKGGTMLRLADMEFVASRYVIDVDNSTDILRDAGRATILRVTSGTGQVLIADDDELKRNSPPQLEVKAGDLVMIPANIAYAFASDKNQNLELSEQRIEINAALA